MIKHIVLFKLKNPADLEKAYAALEGLRDKIPELLELEIGKNFTISERAFDLSLISTFASTADLNSYQNHPHHLPVVTLMREICEKSHVVDYEI